MTLKLRAGVFTADTEYGIALLDEDSDRYWTLNPTAAIVVQTLLDGGDAVDAAKALEQQYAVDFDSALQDVQELVDEFCAAGLVEDAEVSAGPRRVRTWRLARKTS